MNHTDRMIRNLETEKTAQQLAWLYGEGKNFVGTMLRLSEEQVCRSDPPACGAVRREAGPAADQRAGADRDRRKPYGP